VLGFNGGGCSTLQDMYDGDADGSDAVVALTSADDGIIIRNPASSGSDSTYNLVIDQLSTGSKGGLSIQSAGSGNLLLVTDTTSTSRDVLTIANGGVTTFRTQTDSSTGFRVLSAAGTVRFTIDTSGGNVTIGASDTTGALLVLDTKTGSGDPTGVNGGMYYNSNSDKFRCYQNSEWRNCISDSTSGTAAQSDGGTTTSSSYANMPGPSSLSFTKAAASTKLVVTINTTYWTSTSGLATYIGINIGGTDYDCMKFFFNASATHVPISCTRVIPGLSAGSKTIQMRWKSASGTTLNQVVNDWNSITVTETD
jgi:hypothetical protein